MTPPKHRHLARALTAVLFAAAMPGHGQINSDLVCAYPPSTAAAWGGEANTRVNIANGVIGSNALNDQTGTGANFNIVGYYLSETDSSGQDNSTVLGLVASDPSYADVRNYMGSVGADQLIFVPYASTGAAGNAYQPGQFASISSTWWWLVVMAHEAGGHNYGRAHADGVLSPKTIMLHNYCGGGAAWPYFYSDPNIWYGSTQMIGDGATACPSAGTPQINGGDNSGCSAQTVANYVDHIAIGPALNHVIYRWCFTNAPGTAPAGTTNYDTVANAPAVVRGNGATYTGNALRIPGGTTGNVAMSAMSAYVDLPNGIIAAQTNLTIEIWATPLSSPSWARLAEFGSCVGAGDGLGAPGEYTGNPSDPAPGSTSANNAIMLSVSEGTNLASQRLEGRLNSTNVVDFDAALATTAGVSHHYAITFTDGAGAYTNQGGRLEWYRDGYSAGFVDVNFHLSSVQDVNDWLGRSQWSGDSLANNDYAEVRISNVALSQRQILANYALGPNYNPTANLVTLTNSDSWGATVSSFNGAGQWGSGGAPVSGKNYQTYNYRLLTPATTSAYTFGGTSLTVGGDAPGDIEDGLYWGGTASSTIMVNNLIVNNGRLDNRGTGTFTLAGNLTASNTVVVNAMNNAINLSANLNGNGSIVYVGNQGSQNGLITTFFGNPVTLSGNNTAFTGQTIIGYGAGAAGGLTIDSEARLGANPASFTYNQLDMNRGTLTTTTTMSLSNANRGILLDVNGGGFNVSSGTTLTIGCQLSSPVIAGPATGGNLNKSGSGTLILNSPNSGFNGMLYVDTGNSSGNDGVVQLVNNSVMANAHSPIYVRDSGGATSILQLTNSISLSQAVSVNGRGSTAPAIESLGGTNTLAGGINTYGSGSYTVQVDSGILNIGGTTTSSDGGSDTITFQGGGTANLNGTVSGTMSVNKSGSGILNFGNGSTYSGSTIVSQGTLVLAPSTAPVLHLSFNNPAGSGNGAVITNTGTGGSVMNGTIVGAGATIVGGGRYGNALSINGVGGSAATNIVLINNKCVDTSASGSWTVGYWIKTSTAGATIMYQGDGGWSSAGQTSFYLNSNGTSSGSQAGAVRWAGGWLTGTAALNNNAWHFIALVDHAGTESIYVDGNVDAVASSMANPLAGDANQIWIGGSADGGDGAVKLNGLIDEVYLYSRALSQSEIQSLYTLNTTTNAPVNVLPVTSPLTIATGGILDLAGVSQIVAGLSGGGVVTNSGIPATLTISNAGTTAFGGRINDASPADAINLTQSGAGTTILTGTNNYHGATTVTAGTLKLSPVADTSVLHFTFNNADGGANGTVITNVGTGGSALNGTIIGNGASIVSGRYGNALSLNGVGGSAETNIVLINSSVMDTSASGTWTVGYWIKTSTTGAVIMYQGDGGWSSAGQTMFYLNNNGTTSGTHAGAVRWAGGWLTSTATLNNNAWHFVTLVDNAGTESIYVDGALDTVTATMANPLASDANQVWIGGSPDGGDGAVKMTGLIDELYLFNRALSTAEVQSLYGSNSLPANSGSVLPPATPVTVASGATFDVGGVPQTIASLAGAGLVTNTGSATTLTVSNASGTTTFGGPIGDLSAANALSLVQSGASTTILSGVNSYRGTTTVTGGALLVKGTIGTGAVTVTNGTLGGNGLIGGAVTVQSGGTLTPGGSLNPLTVNNSVTLQTGSTTVLEISQTPQTNDQLLVSGTLTYGGTLVVTNLAGTLAAGDAFQLFQAGAIAGSFNSILLPPLNPGLGWNTSSLGSGLITVVQTTPTNLVWSVNGANLNVSWPSGYVGWHLQVQTNALGVGLGTNWVNVSGSSLTNSVALPVDTTQGGVFYRLIYP